MLEGAAVSLDCSVVEEIVAGDHQLVLLRIEELKMQKRIPFTNHRS